MRGHLLIVQRQRAAARWDPRLSLFWSSYYGCRSRSRRKGPRSLLQTRAQSRGGEVQEGSQLQGQAALARIKKADRQWWRLEGFENQLKIACTERGFDLVGQHPSHPQTGDGGIDRCFSRRYREPRMGPDNRFHPFDLESPGVTDCEEFKADPGGHPNSSTRGRVKLLHPDAVNRRRSAPS